MQILICYIITGFLTALVLGFLGEEDRVKDAIWTFAMGVFWPLIWAFLIMLGLTKLARKLFRRES